MHVGSVHVHVSVDVWVCAHMHACIHKHLTELSEVSAIKTVIMKRRHLLEQSGDAQNVMSILDRMFAASLYRYFPFRFNI